MATVLQASKNGLTSLANGTNNHHVVKADEEDESVHCGVVAADANGIVVEEEEADVPEVDIEISNVVCSFSVRCHLNLREIALNGDNVEYKREQGVSNHSSQDIKYCTKYLIPVFFKFTYLITFSHCFP
jgi:hypothetical protein